MADGEVQEDDEEVQEDDVLSTINTENPGNPVQETSNSPPDSELSSWVKDLEQSLTEDDQVEDLSSVDRNILPSAATVDPSDEATALNDEDSLNQELNVSDDVQDQDQDQDKETKKKDLSETKKIEEDEDPISKKRKMTVSLPGHDVPVPLTGTTAPLDPASSDHTDTDTDTFGQQSDGPHASKRSKK